MRISTQPAALVARPSQNAQPSHLSRNEASTLDGTLRHRCRVKAYTLLHNIGGPRRSSVKICCLTTLTSRCPVAVAALPHLVGLAVE